jgi:hypothetical protein
MSSATWNVVIGSGIGLAGTLAGGYMAISTDRRRLARDARVAVYRAWNVAASHAAAAVDDAWQALEEHGEHSPEAVKLQRDANDAMSAMIPSHVDLMLLGVPAPIWDAAEQAMFHMRDVRLHQESADNLRPALEAVFRLMGSDIRRHRSLWSRIAGWFRK